MFELKVQIKDRVDRVRRAARDAKSGSLNRVSFLIRQTMVEFVERAEGPSAPGESPHTHVGNYLKRAPRYAVDKDSAVIGFASSVVDDVGAAHEHGGLFRGEYFEKRPTAKPALDANLDVFANSWSGSIGE